MVKNMKIVIAIDSLKGSLTSLEAGKAIEEGIKRVDQNVKVVVKPLADGGEGTVEALVNGLGGTLYSTEVVGPLGDIIPCEYGVLEERKTAIIEMSAAAGLTLVPISLRNPMNTTTYGVGQLITDAIKKGCRKFIIGIGGSATNDGGIGMLQALGYELLDEDGNQVPYGAKGLEKLRRIETTNAVPELSECSFQIACDVTNPLCGENGCSEVYGPQKGADKKMIKQMDKWLQTYSAIVKDKFIKADSDFPGSGAAGGLGFAFKSVMNATLESGISIVLEEINLEEELKDADLVITGEGRLDSQTAMGKAPIGVAELAKEYNKRVIALAGGVTRDARICNEKGIDAFFPIVRGVSTLEEAMNPENAKNNIMDTVEQVYRLWKIWP